MYTIYFASLINSFKVAFIYYLKYTVSTKEVDGSKYNYSCRLRVKKTRHRLVGRVAKYPQLRANCVNHQPLRPLVGYHILPMY